MSLKCVKLCLDYICISGRSHQEVEGSVVELEATMLPSQRPRFKSVFQHLWTRCHWILWISMLLMRPQDDSQLCLSDKNSVFFNGNLRNLLLCLWQQQQKKDIFDRKLGRLQLWVLQQIRVFLLDDQEDFQREKLAIWNAATGFLQLWFWRPGTDI